MRVRCQRLVVVAAATVMLGGCDLGLATQGGLVYNRTDQDLVVEAVGAPDAHRREVSALSGVQWDAYDECLGTAVALFTPEGEKLAALDRRICDGEQLVIRPEDLPSPNP